MDIPKPKVAFLAVFWVFVALACYRVVNFWVTGFYSPDEFGYLSAHLGQLGYQGRFFFNAVNDLFFGWTGGNIDLELVVLAPYMVFWFACGLYMTWKTLEMLGFDERAQSAVLLLMPLLPAYFLFSLGALTEAVAFPMVMLGLYTVARFRKSGELMLVTIAALAFAAAAYTHIDFTVLLVLGFLPLCLSAKSIKKGLFALLLFLPFTYLFLNWPATIVHIGPLFSTGSTSPPTHPAGPTDMGSSSAPLNIFGQPYTGSYPLEIATIPRAAMLFTVGALGGMGVVFFAALFALKSGPRFARFLGLLASLAFAGTAFLYAGASVVFMGTMVRYSFDLLPAALVLLAVFLSVHSSRKVLGLMTLGLVLTAGVGAFVGPSLLTQNLQATYPFVQHGQDPFLLSYQTPMVAIRDYLLTLPPQHFTILGEDPLSLSENMTQIWDWTPGVSGLSVTWLNYSYARTHTGTFYFYVPPDVDGETTIMNNLQGVNMTSWDLIYPLSDFTHQWGATDVSFFLVQIA